VGLRTARGSGTNGYVATNLAALPKAKKKLEPIDLEKSKPMLRAPNLELLEHDKKREIELKVAEWAEENGVYDSDLPEEKKEELIESARKRIKEETEAHWTRLNEQKKARELMQEYRRHGDRRDQLELEGLSSHLQAKIRDQQRESFREALGIQDNLYKEGDAFSEEVQERKKSRKIKSETRKRKG